MMIKSSLLRQLTRFRRQALLLGFAAGLAWGLASTVILILICAWMDLLWELSPQTRITGVVVALFVGLCLVVVSLVMARRRSLLLALARNVDNAARSGGLILTGTDLALGQPQQSNLTTGLGQLAVANAERLTASVRGADVVPRRRVYLSSGCVFLLATGVFLAALAMPRLLWTQWLRFSDPFGDHPPFSWVTYHVQPKDVRVVYGTGVDVRVRTEGIPVDQLHLVLNYEDNSQPDTIPMFHESDGDWRATISKITKKVRYHVRSRAGRSESYDIDVITVPKLQRVRFRITPPPYTKLPRFEGSLPQGGIAGLVGTNVEVWAQSNRPLSRGALEFFDAKKQKLSERGLSPKPNNEVFGTFVLDEPGEIQIRVIDAEGQASTEALKAPVTILKDERPFLRFVKPPKVSLATPTVNLPLVLAAEDDYGVARIQIYRSLNDSRALPFEVAVPDHQPTRWSDQVILPLSQYGLAPGDEIKFFGRVVDNNPLGPSGMETSVILVRIISQEEFENLIRTRHARQYFLAKYYQALRRMQKVAGNIERLQKKAKGSPAEGAASKKMRQQLAELQKQLQAATNALQKSARHRLPYDLDATLAQYLRNSGRQLQRLADEANKMLKSNMTTGELAFALEKMLKQLKREQARLARETIAPLEHLAIIFPLLEDAARFAMLYERQKELAGRVHSLKGTPPPLSRDTRKRMRELEAEQEEIRDTLKMLLKDIEEHAGRLPDKKEFEPLRKEALEFVQKVRTSGADRAISEARDALAKGNGSKAHAAAARAEKILGQFVKCSQGGRGIRELGGVALRFQPVLRIGLGDTIAQLLADMGLAGLGGGGGHSARRSNSGNIGLYGGMPAFEDMDALSALSGMQPAQGSSQPGRPGANGQTPNSAPNNPGRADGAAAGAIPLTYQSRVSEYFRRIAEETGGN